jgi:c-di-GMP phosphodiesterase
MNDVFLGRQAILDREQRTFGYELLYRDGSSSHVLFDDPDDATRCVMQRAMLDWGMERIIGDRFGFINASAQLIVNGLHRALPPEGIIIELRDDPRFDAGTIDALARAHREGYHFALDNVRELDQLRRSRVLHLASIIKVELRENDPSEIHRIVEWVRADRPGVLLVAEKVETPSEYAVAYESGFDLFEGHFFARPEVLRRAARPSHETTTLALMAEMQRDDVDIDRVEELAGSDPSLAYRLLNVVNSSAFGLDRRVESLRHAIVLLGVQQVRHLAALIAMSSSDDVNEELIAIGVVRARMSSAIAAPELRNGAFTVGLLSVTDSLYRTPMDELLESLPVAVEIRDALLDGTGPYAPLLDVARACEDADVDRLSELVPGRIEDMRVAYADAVRWTDTFRGQIRSRRSLLSLPGRAPATARR